MFCSLNIFSWCQAIALVIHLAPITQSSLFDLAKDTEGPADVAGRVAAIIAD